MKARVSNRLSRHLRATPLAWPGTQPMVSFTFDDIPDSVADAAAPMMEEYGGRGTFYVAGGLLGQWSGHWNGADADDIIGLHARGHEIACHTFSHRRTTDLDADTMAEEIELNRRFLGDSIPRSGWRISPTPMGSRRSRARASSPAPSAPRAA